MNAFLSLASISSGRDIRADPSPSSYFPKPETTSNFNSKIHQVVSFFTGLGDIEYSTGYIQWTIATFISSTYAHHPSTIYLLSRSTLHVSLSLTPAVENDHDHKTKVELLEAG